jgi:hypothetical protein
MSIGRQGIDEISEGVQGGADEPIKDVILWAQELVRNGRDKDVST